MNGVITRRGLLAGASGSAILAGCAKTRHARRPLVSISRAADYSVDLAQVVRRILAEHKLDAREKRVLLKPNLVEFDAGAAINTNPVLVEAAVDAFRAAGAAEVSIAEGPGHRRDTYALAEAAGYFDALSDFERSFTDLNLDEVTRIRLKKPVSALKELYLPDSVLSCDLLVSMPKMKTHHWVGATLSMKNLFGLVPGAVYGWPKNILHWAGINECVADLYSAFPKTFAIVDGIVGMEGNGPIQGTARKAGVIVAGTDLAAVDAACCRIMQIDPAKIEYLRLAGIRGTDAAELIGESLSAVSTPFALIPQFAGLRAKG